MSSRWLTARKRKRVRAVDPYLGFYPQSDPPSEPAQEQQPGMAVMQPVLDTLQAQDTIPGVAQDASSSVMVSSERASCSPKQPRPPKHTYAARKRRRIDSDDEYAQTDTGETEDVSYWSSSDVPANRPARAAIQSTRPIEKVKANTQVKLHKSKLVRGPFATRLIEKSLATSTRLADDLQALHGSTVPQLKLAEMPRVRATQPFIASFVSRRPHRVEIPTYSFPPRRPSMSLEDAPDESGDVASKRDVDMRRPSHPLRLSQLRQPATKAKKKAATNDLVFKPLTFQTVSSRNRTQPIKPPRREPVAPTTVSTAQAVLRFWPVKSARRSIAKSVLAQTHASMSSSTGHGLSMATAPARCMSSQRAHARLQEDHTGRDDWGPASLPTSDIVISRPRSARSSSALQVRQPAPERTSADSISSYSARAASNANSQPTASLGQDSPITLHSQLIPPSLQILVPGTPDRPACGGSNSHSRSPHAAGYSSCFVPASMSVLSSPPAAPFSTDPEQDAVQILVINSSQVLTPDTQLSLRSCPNRSQDDLPPVTPQTTEIFVLDSTQVIVPETSPPPSSQRASVLTKRTKFFKTVADLSDSVFDMIENNAFAARPFTPTR